ncbi:CaiB/BaiF CoA transferase family protein [Saccharopolyspora tripterygii]
MSSEHTTAGPLAGIRVLDLSRFIAGPYCTVMLADMGADVIKVEKRGSGDESRAMQPRVDGESYYVLTFNRNKRSVELDFRSPDDQQTLLDLATKADVLVENFRPGTLEKMGLAPSVLHEVNPKLVITRISGFGQDGPHSQHPCFDAIAQAESGLMSITGFPDGPPTPSGTYPVDYSTGMQACAATLAALYERRTSGLGQVIDLALLDTAYAMLMTGPMEYLLEGTTMGRIGGEDRYGSPGGTFQTSDGWVQFVAGNDTHFARLIEAMARPDLAADPRFATGDDRMQNRAAISKSVTEWTTSLTTDELLKALAEVGVPAGRVADVGEATRNEQLRHRGHLADVQHSTLGHIQVPGVVPHFSRTPGAVRLAPPTLGQHTDEVLKQWLPQPASTTAKSTEESTR